MQKSEPQPEARKEPLGWLPGCTEKTFAIRITNLPKLCLAEAEIKAFLARDIDVSLIAAIRVQGAAAVVDIASYNAAWKCVNSLNGRPYKNRSVYLSFDAGASAASTTTNSSNSAGWAYGYPCPYNPYAEDVYSPRMGFYSMAYPQPPTQPFSYDSYTPSSSASSRKQSSASASSRKSSNNTSSGGSLPPPIIPALYAPDLMPYGMAYKQQFSPSYSQLYHGYFPPPQSSSPSSVSSPPSQSDLANASRLSSSRSEKPAKKAAHHRTKSHSHKAASPLPCHPAVNGPPASAGPQAFDPYLMKQNLAGLLFMPPALANRLASAPLSAGLAPSSSQPASPHLPPVPVLPATAAAAATYLPPPASKSAVPPVPVPPVPPVSAPVPAPSGHFPAQAPFYPQAPWYLSAPAQMFPYMPQRDYNSFSNNFANFNGVDEYRAAPETVFGAMDKYRLITDISPSSFINPSPGAGPRFSASFSALDGEPFAAPGIAYESINTRRLFFGNLPYRTTLDDLRRALCDASLTAFEIEIPFESFSKGYALVTFASEAAAERAIAVFNNAKFQGRRLTVRFDRFPSLAHKNKMNTETFAYYNGLMRADNQDVHKDILRGTTKSQISKNTNNLEAGAKKLSETDAKKLSETDAEMVSKVLPLDNKPTVDDVKDAEIARMLAAELSSNLKIGK